MVPRTAATGAPHPDAVEFVRFCYHRRRVGWPELYDEMCAVAGRGLFRGFSADDLAGIGVGFSLFDMPALASLASRVVAEEAALRRPVTVSIHAEVRRRRPSVPRRAARRTLRPADATRTSATARDRGAVVRRARSAWPWRHRAPDPRVELVPVGIDSARDPRHATGVAAMSRRVPPVGRPGPPPPDHAPAAPTAPRPPPDGP